MHEFTDPTMFVAEGYEYNIQYRWTNPTIIERLGDGWEYSYTNKFNDENWYPKRSSVNNALAQLTATRYGYRRADNREYRIVRRPVGPVEVVDEP